MPGDPREDAAGTPGHVSLNARLWSSLRRSAWPRSGTSNLRTRPICWPIFLMDLQLLQRLGEHTCDAHRDGRLVAVTVLLQREAKLYYLLQPQEFSVLVKQ